MKTIVILISILFFYQSKAETFSRGNLTLESKKDLQQKLKSLKLDNVDSILVLKELCSGFRRILDSCNPHQKLYVFWIKNGVVNFTSMNNCYEYSIKVSDSNPLKTLSKYIDSIKLDSTELQCERLHNTWYDISYIAGDSTFGFSYNSDYFLNSTCRAKSKQHPTSNFIKNLIVMIEVEVPLLKKELKERKEFEKIILKPR